MIPQIVNLNVSQTAAPNPSTFQQTVCVVSNGATTLGVGNSAYVTQVSDIVPLSRGTATITSLTCNGTGLVTLVSTTGAFQSAGIFEVTVTGVTPAAYNGTYQATVAVSGQTLTYQLPTASSPGSATVMGVVTLEEVDDILAAATTYFGQGGSVAFRLLELSAGEPEGSPAAGIAALLTFIQNNPRFAYVYLLPRDWGTDPTLPTLLAPFEAPTAKTYFLITTDTAHYLTLFSATQKDAIVWVESPTQLGVEYPAAAMLAQIASSAPNATARALPYRYRFMYGVTAYPQLGNQPLLSSLQTNYTNVAVAGTEGGIATTMSAFGCTRDGRDFLYWYATDWLQINADLDVSNEIINGSNNPLNPLYYDQPGIDRLRVRAQGTVARGITYGLILGPATVAAIPFVTYVATTPSDFKNGVYNGLSLTFTPNRGFASVTFTVNVTDFPAAA